MATQNSAPPTAHALRPHKLPVEVIERILNFVFPAVPLSSSSTELTPPRGAHTLLAVSHWVREICLPLFYRSITIQKTSDWTLFFGQDCGLFAVDSVHGRRDRWEFVHELAICAGAPLPLLATGVPVTEDDNVHGELAFLFGNKRLNHLVILDNTPLEPGRTRDSVRKGGDDVAELCRRTLASEDGLSVLKERTRARCQEAGRQQDVKAAVQRAVTTHIGERVAIERRANALELLRLLYPVKMTVSLAGWDHLHLRSLPKQRWIPADDVVPPRETLRIGHADDIEAATTVSFEWQNFRTQSVLDTESNLQRQILLNLLVGLHLVLPGAHGTLEGFPDKILDAFERVLANAGSDAYRNLYSDYRWSRKDPRGTWAWEKPDGEVFSFDFKSWRKAA